jgi:hypothetical protein
MQPWITRSANIAAVGGFAGSESSVYSIRSAGSINCGERERGSR